MPLLRKLFYRKPPDGLLEISERIYVFDCCFTSPSWEERRRSYRGYIAGIVSELRGQFPDASLLVFNFRDAEAESRMSKVMSQFDMTIMDYPRHYLGCPVLSMELIHHFLRSTESWLSIGSHNVLLMHCEDGGWPALAFMLAALLLFRKHFSGERRTLEMVYKQAPRELLPTLCALNPLPSQLRYLQYVSRRNVASQWPPLDRQLKLDCIIIRSIPAFLPEGGFRPFFRIYGQHPLSADDRAPKLLFATHHKSNAIALYKQAESELVKIDINCNIQGDVVLECTSLHSDMEHEDMVFRIMFNTSFIRSNLLMLNRDEIDTLWNTRDHFPKDFRAEVLFSDMDTPASVVAPNLSCFEEEGLPMEAFAKVQEFFSHVDWLDSRADAALSVMQKISASRSSRENMDFAAVSGTESSTPVHRSSPQKPKEELNSNICRNSKELDRLDMLALELLKECNLGGKNVESNNFQVQPDLYQSAVTAQKLAEAPHTSMLSNAPSVSQENDTRPHGDTKDGKIASAVPVLSEATCSISPSTPSLLPSQQAPLTSADNASTSSHVLVSRQPHREKLVVQSPRSHANTGLEDAFPSSACPPHSEATAELLPSSPALKDSSFRKELQPATLSHSPATPSKQGPSLGAGSPFPSPQKLPSTPSRAELTIGAPPSDSPAPTSTPSPLPLTPPRPMSLTPPEPALAENSALGAGGQTHPLPTMPGVSTQQSNNNLSKVRPPPPPPPPTHFLEGSAGNSGKPPPSVAPSSKDNYGLVGPPPAPPPPPQSGSSRSSAAPPPPPPPGSGLASGHLDKSQASSSVPSAPRSSVAFEKGDSKTGAGAPAPAPAPPVSSINTKGLGRSLSRSLGPKSPQTKKLKPLHWLKLTRAVQGSLWAENQKSGEGSKAPEIDMSELENLFSASVPVADRGAAAGQARRSVAGHKPEKVQLIDHRRACNCEIMLSKVKVPIRELMGSVLSLEDSSLDIDQVDNLIKFSPTKEEIDLLKGYTGEPDKLGKCEQFFLELMRVPRVEAKLRVFSFKMQFKNQVSDLRESLNTLNSASDQIRSSVKLKKIMQTILSLGNALNQGTARGSAIGFRLDSLMKLTETRARNNKMTLMHYLCKVIAEKLPELLDFSKDITSTEPASKIQLKFLAEEMQAINKGLEKVVQELCVSENDGPISEGFRKNLKEFLYIAEAEVRSLALLYSGVGRNVDALIVYFGEDPSRCPFEQVVATLLNFTKMFDRAREENCKQLELEKKKAEKV